MFLGLSKYPVGFLLTVIRLPSAKHDDDYITTNAGFVCPSLNHQVFPTVIALLLILAPETQFGKLLYIKLEDEQFDKDVGPFN